MKKLKVVLLWVLSIVFVLLIVQNTTPVRAHFLWLVADVPIIMLLLFASAVGFISGLFIRLPIKRSGQRSTHDKRTE
ncbi:MAG: LapA family protein [Chitinispirillaceae bacterium]|nr:LapA family protein [Chitinispirillaceae bacterium]